MLSWELAEELVDVLRRPKLRKYQIEEQDVADILELIAGDLPDVDVDVALRDPQDAPVVAAAVAGNARAIVTGDADLLELQELQRWLAERGVEVLTPGGPSRTPATVALTRHATGSVGGLTVRRVRRSL